MVHTPVPLSYLYLSLQDAILYISPKSLDAKAKKELEQDGIQLRLYDKIYEDLPELTEKHAVLLDTACVNYSLYCSLSGDAVNGTCLLYTSRCV